MSNVVCVPINKTQLIPKIVHARLCQYLQVKYFVYIVHKFLVNYFRAFNKIFFRKSKTNCSYFTGTVNAFYGLPNSRNSAVSKEIPFSILI